MPQSDFTLEFVKDQPALLRLAGTLESLPVLALDIETADWWSRRRERLALVQIAYRQDSGIKVAVIDALAKIELETLRAVLESAAVTKIIHNADFDAARLEKHHGFRVAPVFDTMLAARRSGEKKYSLKAQAEIHLQMHLDKSARTSDWSSRPLSHGQLYYAARDPFATLLLYEHQKARNLDGRYLAKSARARLQGSLPLNETKTPPIPGNSVGPVTIETEAAPPQETAFDLSETAIALLGIVTELPTRYSPGRLAASLEIEGRGGVAGWIFERRLGKEAEADEETVKMTIAELIEQGLIRITASGRLEATVAGERLWSGNYK